MERAIEIRVKKLLLKIGASPSLRGFEPLVKAVTMMYENGSRAYPLTKKIYPELANILGASPNNIERNMRYAIEQIQSQNWIKILGVHPSSKKRKLTNRQFLAACVENLKMEDEEVA